MFEPQKFIDSENNYFVFRNENLNNQLPIFYLLTTDSFIGFPYLPNQIEYGYNSKYNRVARVLGSNENLQFLGNTIDDLNVNNLIVSSRKSNKTWEKLIKKLRDLMLKDEAIAVCLQNRVVGDYLLADLKVVENGWIDGMPCSGNISLQFIQDDRLVQNDYVDIPDEYNQYSRDDYLTKYEFKDGKELEIKSDDTLSKIAFKEYGNVSLWRDILDNNPEFGLFETDSLVNNIFLPGKLKEITKNDYFVSIDKNNLEWLL